MICLVKIINCVSNQLSCLTENVDMYMHISLYVSVFVVQLDVVVADLDGGSIRLPENVHISLMPEPLLSRMLLSLRLVSFIIYVKLI